MAGVLGQDTQDVPRELQYSNDEMSSLRGSGAI